MITIAYNAVWAKVANASKAELLEVNRLLSYTSDPTTSGGWGTKQSFFNFSSQTFPSGFVGMVARGLKAFGSEVRVASNPIPPPLGPERPPMDDFGYTDRYDYQPAAVDALVKHHQITVQVSTGGGKSLIARMAMKRINRPTLFLTTRGVLMHQMHRSIETMTGRKCAILGDGEWGIEKEDGTRAVSKFTVGMVQTLAQRLTKKTVESEVTAEISRIHTANKAKIDKYAAELRKQKLSPADIGEKLVKFKKKIERDTPSNKEIALKVRSKVEKHEALREQTERILGKFEFVIVEEAHEVSSESFYTVMAACRNARYRMALTATPFMKDSEESNMRLLASCGPVAIRITEKTLIDRGILAKPYFRFVNIPKSSALTLTRTTPWPKAYQIGIVENEARNFLIVKEVKRASEYGLNSMILVQRKDHGTVLKELLAHAGLRAEFIFGEDDQKARDKALTGLKNGEIDVLIGSTILDVGVDVPSVGMVVLAGGGKAEVATRQRIGRGLREKKNGGPNCAFIVDFNDDVNNHLQKHAKERRKIIDSTPGFAENIVADFDYEALGFKRKHGQVMPD